MWARWWLHYRTWWQRQQGVNQWAWVSVAVATLLGATYRLVHLRQTMQFLADQGRDAIIAWGILQGDIALVGPSTSVGDMYLGPLYYYFMAPWIGLFGGDPIGPAVAVAVLGILTIPVLFLVGRDLLGPKVGAIAALLYACAPVVAEYTRFSWNPNPAPMVMLLLLYGLYKAWVGSKRWWVVVGVAFAIIIQLHYVALLAAAPAMLVWMAQMFPLLRTGKIRQLQQVAVWSLAAVAVVLISFAPLVAFDFRFDHTISRGFVEFFQSDEAPELAIPLSQKIERVWREQHGRAMHVLFEIWGNKDWTPHYRQLNSALLGLYVVMGIIAGWRLHRTKYAFGFWLLLAAVVPAVVGLAWYRGQVFHHYISFLFPVSYLITALIIVEFSRWHRLIGSFLGIMLMTYVLWLSVTPRSLLYLQPLGWNVTDVERTADQIVELVPEDQTYAMATLSDVRDYRGMNYRYFLLTSSHPPVPLEVFDTADILVVIAENPKDPGLVLSSPVYEIAAFPKGEYAVERVEVGPDIFLIERSQVTQTEENKP